MSTASTGCVMGSHDCGFMRQAMAAGAGHLLRVLLLIYLLPSPYLCPRLLSFSASPLLCLFILLLIYSQAYRSYPSFHTPYAWFRASQALWHRQRGIQRRTEGV